MQGLTRTNLAKNTRAVTGAGGWASNNAASWTVALGVAPPAAHPAGLLTASRTNPQPAYVGNIAASLYNLGNEGGPAQPVRFIGVWVYTSSPNMRMQQAGGVVQWNIPVPPNVWTWCAIPVTFAAGVYAGVSVVKNPGAGDVTAADVVYMTGALIEETSGGEFFDGDTPDVPATETSGGLEYAWTGAPNASTSTEETTPVLPPPPPEPARQRPAVTIGSTVIPDSLDDSATIIALAGLTLDWGKEDVYARVDPSMLALELMDRDGIWSADTARYGELVRIALPSGRVIFRGSVTETHMILTNISTESGIERVWRTTIRAVDILADLDRDAMSNGGTDTVIYPEPVVKAGGTNAVEISMQTHYARMMNAGMSRYVDATIRPADLSAAHGFGRSATTNDVPTWLEMLYQLWRALPFAAVNYDPDAHALVGLQPASAAGIHIALVFVDDTIRLRAESGSSGVAPVSLTAARLEVDNVELTSTIQSAITTVEIAHNFKSWSYHEILGNRYFFPASAWSDSQSLFTVPGTSAAIARSVSVPLRSIVNPPANPPTLPPGSVIPELPDVATGPPISTVIGPAWAAAVAQVNGKLMPPDAVYDFERWPEDVDVEAFMLRTYAAATPVFISAAYTAGLPNVPSILEVIGGRLRWDDGWESTMHFGPTLGAGVGVGVAINELVTTPDPGFDDYDPAITLADLGTVTKGVS